MLDIFVAVSLQESFGVSVLEASACGKPVVVSDVGGLPEVVDNGQTGIIVESKNSDQLVDALMTLINNPDLRKKMGDAGRSKVMRDFSWDSSVKKMLFIYSNLLNNNN
jgi:glycosyltransferase involved in cell wall biosynthesis